MTAGIDLARESLEPKLAETSSVAMDANQIEYTYDRLAGLDSMRVL